MGCKIENNSAPRHCSSSFVSNGKFDVKLLTFKNLVSWKILFHGLVHLACFSKAEIHSQDISETHDSNRRLQS